MKSRFTFETKSFDLEIKEQLNNHFSRVISYVESIQVKTDTKVHKIRMSFKKARAVLRLSRDAMGYASYYHENLNIRNMHRLLSNARETVVYYGLLIKMGKLYPDLADQDWYKWIKEEAKVRRDAELRALGNSDVSDYVLHECKKTMDRVMQMKLRGEGFELISGGLSRIYQQGYKGSREVFRNKINAECLHRFRKKAKYFQYQNDLLITLFPEVLKANSKAFHKLTDALGEYNDWHQLLEGIPQQLSISSHEEMGFQAIAPLIEAEKQRILKKAESLAMKLYAEHPSSLLTRIKSYWETYSYQMN